ncbi:hypothetical protein MJD09_00415 [bacterium]|nr:hypothetical protein [bacterium]
MRLKFRRFVSVVSIVLLMLLTLGSLSCNNSPILGPTVVEPPDDKINGNPDDDDPKHDG